MRRRNKKWKWLLSLLLVVGSCLLLIKMFQWISTPATTLRKNLASEDVAEYQQKANLDIENNKEPERLAVPLLLQKNKNWSAVPYGVSDDEGNLGKNGCAILCLAMLDSYYENRLIAPNDLVSWSGDDYYVAGAGTSWEIFAAYCQYKGWDFQNLGNDLTAAQQALLAGYPVIASVSAGTFTSAGNILLLTGYSEKGFYVNDPNDDAEKNHFYTTFSWENIQQEGVNYWSIRG